MMANRMMAVLSINAGIQHRDKKLFLDEKEVLCVALDSTCTFTDGSEILVDDEQLADLCRQMEQ